MQFMIQTMLMMLIIILSILSEQYIVNVALLGMYSQKILL